MNAKQAAGRLRTMILADHTITPAQADLMREIIAAGEQALRQEIVFRFIPGPYEPRGACFEIYRTSEEPHRYYSRLGGAWAVWRAIADRGFGASLCSMDLIPPHATTDKGLSRSINHAAAWFARLGFPELESACQCVHITGGLLSYEPAGSAPRIRADMGEPTWAPDRRPVKMPRQ